MFYNFAGGKKYVDKYIGSCEPASRGHKKLYRKFFTERWIKFSSPDGNR